MGLGLAIVKRIVEGHRDQIEARSAGANQGAEFILRLPLLAEEPSLSEPEETPRANSAVRVLIVDDNEELIDLMGVILEMLGYEVHLRYSGKEVLPPPNYSSQM